jgi:hypothetical protein
MQLVMEHGSLIATSSGTSAAIGGLIIVIVAFSLYFLPTIIGASRKVVNVGSVLAINLLLGWTLIGWAVALAMALRTNPPHAYPQYWQQGAQLPLQQLRPQAPPTSGWYQDPHSGSTRWWDGQQWGALAATEASSTPVRGPDMPPVSS